MAEPWEFDVDSLDTTPEAVSVDGLELPARVVAWLRAKAAYSEMTMEAAIAEVLAASYDDQFGERADVEHSLRLAALAEAEA